MKEISAVVKDILEAFPGWTFDKSKHMEGTIKPMYL